MNTPKISPKFFLLVATILVVSLACSLFTPKGDSGYTPPAVAAQNTPAPAQAPANPQSSSATTTYKVDGNTVMVYSGEVLIAKIEFTKSVDNHPSEWLKDRPGIGYLYQSGVNNTVKMKVTLYEGGSFAMDGDWMSYGGMDLGKINDAADFRAFADAPGEYSFTASSFGLAIGVYRASDDKAGYVLLDRRNADNDNRPEYWLPTDGSAPKEVGK